MLTRQAEGMGQGVPRTPHIQILAMLGKREECLHPEWGEPKGVHYVLRILEVVK